MSVYKNNDKWYCQFQIDGERKHRACKGAKNRKEAEKLEQGFMYQLQQQQNGVMPRKEKKISVDKLCDKFLEYSKLNKKSYKQDISRIKIIRQYLKKYKYVNDIKPDHIEQLKSALLIKGRSKTTINRYLEVLCKMFNIAIDNDWLSKNPIKRGMKFPQKNYVIRSLSVDEENRLISVLSTKEYEYLKGIVIVALNTALRRQNILDLTWEQIDLRNRVIEITENKANKHILKPINDTLYAYFTSIPKEKRIGYVFINYYTGRKCKEIKRAWKTVKQKANITNFRFHDLKHTVGTRLAQNNVPIPVIKEVLDHSDIKTTMRYVHTANEQILSAMNKLNSYNKDILQNP